MIGETIKDFTITARLGAGGMGEVFAAEHRLIKTKVAIKMLLPHVSTREADVERFFNEAKAASKIKHAGIVKIFDVGIHDQRAYLVMELLEGESVAARMRAGLRFSAVLDIAKQVASILAATHAEGITHRDLKPDNMFLVRDAELGERVKILDFGIAKLADVSATALSTQMGTPAYMPPELWQDARTSGPPTDVYAFGAVLFELCCGRPPFTVTGIADACDKHLHAIPPRLHDVHPELPAALDELIARMLEKAQDARPSIAEITKVLGELASAPVTIPQASPATGPGAYAKTAIGHGDDDPAALEAQGRWMELIKVLGKQVEAAPPADKAALYFKIAGVYQDRFANLAEAIKAYEHVLAHDPEHRKALDALRALYEKRRDWEKLLELEKGELGRTPVERRADKAVDVARLASMRVSSPAIQLYWWERVLEHEPDHRQAFTELTKLYAHAERWADLAELLRRQAELAPGNDDHAAALRKLAVVQGRELGDRAAALATLEALVELDPRDGEAQQRLATLRAGGTVEWTAVGGRDAATLATGAGAPASIPAEPVQVASRGDEPSASAGPVIAPARSRRAASWVAIGSVVALVAGAVLFVRTRSSERATAPVEDGPDPRHVGNLPPWDSGDGSGSSNPNGATDSNGSNGSNGSNRSTGSDGSDGSHGSHGSDGSSGSAGAAVITARGLTLSYRVLARPAAGGELRAIAPDDQLHTGDRVAFEIMVSAQAHVFLGQRPKGKSLAVLFPNPGIEVGNPLPPNTWVRIPSGTRTFRLTDQDVGRETVYFVASRTPLVDLAAAIASEGKPGAKPRAVEEQLVAVAMEHRTDCAGRGRELVLDAEDDCRVKTRGLELDDDRDARRVRGVTLDDLVFVPFRFRHAPAIGGGP